MASDPLDFQEVHSPTEMVEAVVSHQGKRTRAAYRQRVADKRLLEGLTTDELRAFVEIDRARNLAAVSRHVRAQVYERVDFGSAPTQESRYQNILLRTFDDWSRLILSHEKLDYSAIIAIISEGYSPNKVDRDRRKANGWARGILGGGLGLWCELRGWG